MIVYLPGAADWEALTESNMEPLDTGPTGTNQYSCFGFDWITVKVTPGTKRLEGKLIVTCWLAVRTFLVVKVTAAFNEYHVTIQSEHKTTQSTCNRFVACLGNSVCQANGHFNKRNLISQWSGWNLCTAEVFGGCNKDAIFGGKTCGRSPQGQASDGDLVRSRRCTVGAN